MEGLDMGDIREPLGADRWDLLRRDGWKTPAGGLPVAIAVSYTHLSSVYAAGHEVVHAGVHNVVFKLT